MSTALGDRPGRLLAALVARIGRPTPTETLVDMVWGESAPATARSALHVHLGTVRKVLAPTGASVVRTSAGYDLAVGEASVDAVDFVSSCEEARRKLLSDPLAALRRARAGLALWRGRAYAGSDDEPVEPVAANALELARRDLEELAVDAMLAVDELADAERTALALVAAEPFRERRWVQLVTARYLAGRQADALATCREATAMLREELGVDPGLQLQMVERAVLTHDVERLVTRPPAPVQVAPPPATGGALIGRSSELMRCHRALGADRVVVITGPPGVGKTRLAEEFARDAAVGGVAWIDLREFDDVAEAAEILAGAIRLSDERGHLAGWLREGGVRLVVLDNAEHVLGAVRTVVNELRRAAPGTQIVVTSRADLGLDGQTTVRLKPLAVPTDLDDDGAIERSPSARLIRAALDDLDAGPMTTCDVATLCRAADGLPLALRLAAAASRTIAPDVLAANPGPVATGYRSAAEASLALVGEPAATVFRLLGTLSGAVDIELAGAVCGLDAARLREAVTVLADHGLVQPGDTPQRHLSLLEPLREVALELAEEAGELDIALERSADHLIERARQWTAVLGRGGSLDAAVVTGDLHRYRSTLERLARRGDERRALSLAVALEAPLYVTGRWRDKLDLVVLALTIPGPPSSLRARALTYRARPGQLSSMDLDDLEEAAAMAQSVGDDRTWCLARHFIGIARWWMGDFAGSLQLNRAAVEWFEATGNTLAALEARKFVGVALVANGDHRAGTDELCAVLAEWRKVGIEFHIAHTLAYLGHCRRHIGDDIAGVANLLEAADMCRRWDNTGTLVHVLLGLAEAALDRGDVAGCGPHLAQAFDAIELGGSTVYAAWAWTIAARWAAAEHDDIRAAGCLARAVAAADAEARLPGETARVGREAAAIIVDHDAEVAARLLGVAEASPGPRELPFPTPAEGARAARALANAIEALGERRARACVAEGGQYRLAEALGSVLIGA